MIYTKIKMPEPVAAVRRTATAITYKHKSSLGLRLGENALITTDQAEAYAAAKVRESQEWQPIETAPKDGTEIIGWNGKIVTAIAYLSDEDDDGHSGWCQSGYTDGGMLYYLHNALSDEGQPTHWMPLPHPPTE